MGNASGTINKDHPVYVVDGDGSSNHLSGIVQISVGIRVHTCALNSEWRGFVLGRWSQRAVGQ